MDRHTDTQTQTYTLLAVSLKSGKVMVGNMRTYVHSTIDRRQGESKKA